MDVKFSDSSVIPFATDRRLSDLLDQSFPDTFEGRCFFKQEPHCRIVAHTEGSVIGQVGIDRRVVNVAGKIVKIIGVIDLCVAAEYRGNGIGTALLREIEDHSTGREFIILMADNHSIYEKSGYFRLQPALARWLAIEELNSHSIIERDLSDCFMYKPLSSADWPAGKIDLLGYLF